MLTKPGKLPCSRAASLLHMRLVLALIAGSAPASVLGGFAVTTEGTMGQHQRPTAVSTARPTEVQPKLPQTIAGWKRAGPTRRIETAAIFEYMDGAGELYLSYRFDHLEVIEYRSDTEGDILVELYWMGSSDDAFGLLSGDWGGEAVQLSPTAGAGRDPFPRALYGSGLLRVWSDDLYARILATRESTATRGAVLALGRAITEGRRSPRPPLLATVLPVNVKPGLGARADRLCFLRSHLVLNSVYFLSQRDMLDLGPSVEAVFVPYELSPGGGHKGTVKVLVVRYGASAIARQALAGFRATYLAHTGSEGGTESGAERIEDGWVAYRVVGRSLALVFEGPDRDVAVALLEAVASCLTDAEVSNE